MTQYRIAIGMHGCWLFARLVNTNNWVVIILTIYCLLLKCGDIHPNPGPPGMSFCHLNVQSLLSGVDRSKHIQSQASKLDDIFESLVVSNKYDILSFTETWLSSYISSQDITLQGYQLPFRTDRSSRGGGSMIYVSSQIPAVRCPELELGPCECTWVELTPNNKKIYLGVYYRPPGQTSEEQEEFLESFQASLDLVFMKDPYSVICTGDFNDRCLSWEESHSNSELGNKLRDLVSGNNLFQLVNEPTRITELHSSLLDLIITDTPGLFSHWGVNDSLCISDHILVYGVLSLTAPRVQSKPRFVWHYNRADFDSINAELNSIDWEHSFAELTDVDLATDFLINNVKAASFRHIPYRKICMNVKDKPWMTSYIKHLIRLRNRSSKVYNRKATVHNKTVRNIYRSMVKEEIKLAKVNHYNRQAKMLEDCNCNPKRYWSVVKTLLGNKVQATIPTLVEGDSLYQTDQEKAEHLNNYFHEQSMLDNIPDNHTLPEFKYLTDARLTEIRVTEEQVYKVLLNLNVNKASGPDGIGNMLLKNIAHSITKPLTLLYNKSLVSGKFPKQWKLANITAIHKKNDPSNAKNYRPVSLLSCLGKVFERTVHNIIYDHLERHHLLTERNSGFKKNDGTINQLTHILDHIYAEIDKRRDVAVIFLDITKAFDKVYHKGLLFKLRQCGIEGTFLKWIESYLTDRQQRVVLNGTSSTWQVITAGVPQGSILGPLLFLVFINDIVGNIQSMINLFADDTSLMKSISNPSVCLGVLQEDLNALSCWAKQWLVTFNASKTVYMLFSSKRQAPVYPKLTFDGTELTQVTEHTHLGMTLNSRLTWHSHINKVTTKAYRVVNMLKRIRHLVPRSTLEGSYRTLVRPILEYGNIVYSNIPIHLSKKLEQVQRAAALLCTGAYRRTSYDKLLVELGWETLETRRRYQRLVLMYKMQNGLTPGYLSNMLPTEAGSNYHLRNSGIIRVPFCRTNQYKSSFLPCSIREWNELSQPMKNIPTLYSFKKQIKETLFANKPNKLNQFGQKQANKHHTWLRLGLSPLRDHLYSFHIVEDNLCTFCSQGSETTSHFLFSCSNFTAQRAHLMKSLSDILGSDFNNYSQTMLTRMLTHGNDELSYYKNIAIFTSVQSYLEKSKRFDFNNEH